MSGPDPERTAAEPTSSSPPPHEELILRGRRSGISIVTVLIVINVAIWLIRGQSRYWDFMFYGYGALQTEAVVRGEVWRLVTAQYLHAGFWHVAINMLGLYFLGRPLEETWSRRKFLAIYTLCGLAGNVFFTVLGTKGVIDPRQAAVGASGCVYGLLGIVAVLFPRSDILVYGIFPVRIRTAAVVMGGLAFMSVVERGSNYGGEACHLAGLAFGVWWASHGDDWWSSTDWIWNRSKASKPPGT